MSPRHRGRGDRISLVEVRLRQVWREQTVTKKNPQKSDRWIYFPLRSLLLFPFSLSLSFLSSLALVSTNASLGTDSCSSLINRANNARKASSHGCSPARPNLGCSCTSPGKRTRQVPFPSTGLALLSAQSAAACEPPNLTLPAHCALASRPFFRNHRPTPQFTGRTPTP